LKELSLHLLDIAENSVAANSTVIEIIVAEYIKKNQLWMTVSDDGKGMDAEMVRKVVDPFVTSRTTRKVGLGIPLLKEAAEACNGWLTIESEVGKGTTIKVMFQRNHIDRMPMGDLAGTLLSLLISNPEIHWIFKYELDEDQFIFDDADIKRELEGISLTEPDILAFLRQTLENGVGAIKPSDSW